MQNLAEMHYKVHPMSDVRLDLTIFQYYVISVTHALSYDDVPLSDNQTPQISFSYFCTP